MNSLFRDCGEALHGPRWQTALAADLGVADRTVRRWIATDEVPPGVYVDLLRLVTERATALNALGDRLRLAAAP